VLPISAPEPEKRWTLPVVGSPAPLTIQTVTCSKEEQRVTPEIARVVPDKGALASAVAGKAPLTVVEDQEKRRKEDVDKELGLGHDVHAKAAIEPLVERDVAASEPLEKGEDQVVWADASETMRLADPKALEPVVELHAHSVGQANRSSMSPSALLEGSTLGAFVAVLVEDGDCEGTGRDLQKEVCAGVFWEGSNEHICVSISENMHSYKATSSVPGQLMGCARSTESGEEPGSSQASSGYTGPNSLMQLVPRGLGRQLEEEVRSPDVADREE
jgi:hypothetical protein